MAWEVILLDYPAILKQIDEKKALLDSKRPFPRHTLESLREKLLVEWTYHSNAIEGNTLTLSETKVVLEGITIGGKTLREHLEVINHREAIGYIEEIITKKEDLSDWQIKNIHAIVLKGILPESAGVYRRENVFISGAEHIPPDYVQVPAQMAELLEWYKGEAQKLHAVERAAILHSWFVKIHPFVDGNGRTARLLLNFELMKNGYVPIVIKKEQRVEYYDSLDFSHVKGDYSGFVKLAAQILEDTFDFYIRHIG
ncbi:Fic family protein [Sporomusa aerivorans]|uniref:Fic family protein n=1 Tax=Sporomusa aerivorans TaxID=204936 RepID=UPI00352AD0ED